MAKIKSCIPVLLLVSCFCLIFAARPGLADTVTTAYPRLGDGLLKNAQLTDLKDGLILQTGKISFRESNLLEILNRVDAKIKPQLARNLFFLLQQETTKALLIAKAEEAGLRGKDKDGDAAIQAVLEKAAESAVVTEEEILEFYKKNAANLNVGSVEEVRDSIRDFLLEQKQQTIIKTYLAGLGEGVNFSIDRSWMAKQYALAIDNPVDKARDSGKPTMIEFGATGCVPCDMMQPILERLRKKYGNRLNVVFVHVGEEQVLSGRFGIQSIPVQVFYDKQGAEVFRHVGFFAEDEVTKVLAGMGL